MLHEFTLVTDTLSGLGPGMTAAMWEGGNAKLYGQPDGTGADPTITWKVCPGAAAI
ncbi:hypothetical protein D3C81_2295070 [compost metagenome]